MARKYELTTRRTPARKKRVTAKMNKEKFEKIKGIKIQIDKTTRRNKMTSGFSVADMMVVFMFGFVFLIVAIDPFAALGYLIFISVYFYFFSIKIGKKKKNDYKKSKNKSEDLIK